nr:twin-arginine translocation signal domain-containing protein [Pseudoalteromonas sp. T1lg22]
MQFTRRRFLKASAAGFGAAVLSLGLSGCVLDNDSDEEQLMLASTMA